MEDTPRPGIHNFTMSRRPFLTTCVALLLAGVAGILADDAALAQTALRGAIDDTAAAPRRVRPPEANGGGDQADQEIRPGDLQSEKARRRVRRSVQAASVRGSRPLELRPNTVVRSPSPSTARQSAPASLSAPAPGLAPPAEAPRRRAIDTDPYAPLGLRLGNIQVNLGNEASIGYDDNTARTNTAKKGSLYLRDAAELQFRSDWSRHELSGDLRGGYSWYKSDSDSNRPDANARIGLRLDASRDTQINLETRFLLDSQRPSSPDLNANATGRPLTFVYGASAGVTQRYNRLILDARASVDRSAFEDAKLSNGTTLDQSTRNLNDYGLRLRAGYELQPGFVPFVEATVDSRQYDKTLDASGFRRSSTGVQGRAGTTYEITRTLTTEVAAGYGTRQFDDNRLKDLRGVIADAAITWSATPLTTLTLRAATTFDETSIAGASGSIGRRVALDLNHQLLRNLALGAQASYTNTSYRGISRNDDTVSGGPSATYRFNRTFAVRASYTHERLYSTVPGQSYRSNIWQLGARADL